MPLQGEVLADQPEALEERLSARRVAKPSHASLAFAGRLMAVLGAVVHAGSSSELVRYSKEHPTELSYASAGVGVIVLIVRIDTVTLKILQLDQRVASARLCAETRADKSLSRVGFLGLAVSNFIESTSTPGWAAAAGS